MRTLNEWQLRQIIQEEFETLNEAPTRRIVRPGEPSTPRPQSLPVPEEHFSRPKIASIGDIQANAGGLRAGSVFVAGSNAFNQIYNGGNAEELIRFKVKGKNIPPDESYLISRLVSHTFNEGTFFIVPELYDAGKCGVGQIISITNRPVPGETKNMAPLVLAEFKSGQHTGIGGFSPDSSARVANIGLAFLVKISGNDVSEYANGFRAKVRANASKPKMGGMTTVKYRSGQ